MRLILFGPPGAGKGTQAVAITEEFELVHIATGDIFRAHAGNETELGRRAKEYMDRGDLVPDEIVIGMVDDRVTQDDAVNGFLLDGFPRTVAQAEALDRVLERDGHHIDGVVRLVVADEELVTRLLNRAREQGRSDDTRGVIEKRLAVYREQTEPLVKWYDERGVMRDVDGEGDIAAVRERVLAAIREVAKE
jgi:adenylate kinase